MIQRAMRVLAVRDLRESADYYQKMLGFSVHEIGDDGWRLLERDACRIMVGHCPDAIPAADTGDHSYFAYMILDDANAFYSELEAKDADITKVLRDEPWGMREFGVRTNDGHRIMFGQVLE